jgi:hypothetical protein
LRDILTEYRSQIDAQHVERLKSLQQERARPRLPEPAGQRVQLQNEIAFFLSNFKATAQAKGVRLEAVLPVGHSKTGDLVKYMGFDAMPNLALALPRPSSRASSSSAAGGTLRPMSALSSRPSSATPAMAVDDDNVDHFFTTADLGVSLATISGRPSSSSSSRLSSSRPSSARPSSARSLASSTTSSTEDVLEAVAPYLNAFDIDQVTGSLRAELDREHEYLLAEAEELQCCLDDEMNYASELNLTVAAEAAALDPVEPTVKELRDWKVALETSWNDHEADSVQAARLQQLPSASSPKHKLPEMHARPGNSQGLAPLAPLIQHKGSRNLDFSAASGRPTTPISASIPSSTASSVFTFPARSGTVTMPDIPDEADELAAALAALNATPATSMNQRRSSSSSSSSSRPSSAASSSRPSSANSSAMAPAIAGAAAMCSVSLGLPSSLTHSTATPEVIPTLATSASTSRLRSGSANSVAIPALPVSGGGSTEALEMIPLSARAAAVVATDYRALLAQFTQNDPYGDALGGKESRSDQGYCGSGKNGNCGSGSGSGNGGGGSTGDVALSPSKLSTVRPVTARRAKTVISASLLQAVEPAAFLMANAVSTATVASHPPAVAGSATVSVSRPVSRAGEGGTRARQRLLEARVFGLD